MNIKLPILFSFFFLNACQSKATSESSSDLNEATAEVSELNAAAQEESTQCTAIYRASAVTGGGTSWNRIGATKCPAGQSCKAQAKLSEVEGLKSGVTDKNGAPLDLESQQPITKGTIKDSKGKPLPEVAFFYGQFPCVADQVAAKPEVKVPAKPAANSCDIVYQNVKSTTIKAGVWEVSTASRLGCQQGFICDTSRRVNTLWTSVTLKGGQQVPGAKPGIVAISDGAFYLEKNVPCVRKPASVPQKR